jgi:hypothetical protein
MTKIGTGRLNANNNKENIKRAFFFWKSDFDTHIKSWKRGHLNSHSVQYLLKGISNFYIKNLYQPFL